ADSNAAPRSTHTAVTRSASPGHNQPDPPHPAGAEHATRSNPARPPPATPATPDAQPATNPAYPAATRTPGPDPPADTDSPPHHAPGRHHPNQPTARPKSNRLSRA